MNRINLHRFASLLVLLMLAIGWTGCTLRVDVDEDHHHDGAEHHSHDHGHGDQDDQGENH